MQIRSAPQHQNLLTRLFGGVGLRLLVGVLAFSSVVTLILTALQLYLDYRRDVGAIEDRLDEIGSSYLGAMGESLWNLDRNQLHLQLSGILRLPDISSARVYETTDTPSPLAISLGDEHPEAGIVRQYPIVHQIRGGQQTIGHLHVEATLTGVYRSLLDRALIILVSQGAKTFLVSFFILLIFHRLVTRHLSDMADFLGGFSFQGPKPALTLQRSAPKQPDEFDQVVAAFNTMIAKLQSAYSQISEANARLERDNAALARAEAALRENEQRFRDYTETASDWFWETDTDHASTYLSDEIRAFGFDREKLIGAHRWDFATDLLTEPDKWRAHRALLEQRKPFRNFVYSMRENDGPLCYLTSSGKPVFDEDGRFLGYRGTARDITARSLAEARVRELSLAVEQSPAGIAVVDVNGRLIYSNRVFLQIVGLDEIGEDTTMASILPEGSWQHLSAAAQRGSTGRDEVFAKRLSQEPFWGLVSVAGLKASAGEAKHLVVVLQDITREKAAQQEREALLQRLQHTGKIEAIGRLAGGIAHDFNNLLGAMMGFSQFLVEDLPEGSASHKHAQRIVDICEKGKELIDQLLAFAGARDTERRVLDVAAVVQHSRNLMETCLPSSCSLLIETGDESLPVLSNEVQLHQVLLNLCINARDAFGAEPGTVSVALSRVRPDRDTCAKVERKGVGRLQEGEDYALMVVSDTGAGMDAETQAQIFEPFYTTKGLGRGTGLGLAVVHGIVTSYDGAIYVESETGVGTTFEIYLPLASAPLAPAVEEAAPDEKMHGNERILVVDDDRDLAQALTIGLHRYGYEVLSLTNPADALRIFSEEPGRWDLVVSDQVMPGMTGLRLVAKLKELRPDLRAILYTGFDEKITAGTASLQGIDALLHKPVTPQQLAVQVRRVLDSPSQSDR